MGRGRVLNVSARLVLTIAFVDSEEAINVPKASPLVSESLRPASVPHPTKRICFCLTCCSITCDLAFGKLHFIPLKRMETERAKCTIILKSDDIQGIPEGS